MVPGARGLALASMVPRPSETCACLLLLVHRAGTLIFIVPAVGTKVGGLGHAWWRSKSSRKKLLPLTRDQLSTIRRRRLCSRPRISSSSSLNQAAAYPRRRPVPAFEIADARRRWGKRLHISQGLLYRDCIGILVCASVAHPRGRDARDADGVQDCQHGGKRRAALCETPRPCRHADHARGLGAPWESDLRRSRSTAPGSSLCAPSRSDAPAGALAG